MTLQPGLLQVAAFSGFPPFVWKDGHRVCGGDIRLLEEFATSQSLELSVRFFGFEALWQLPGQGVADIAASGLSRLSSRAHTAVTWSAPYSEVRRTALLRRQDRQRFRDPESFRHARFGVVADSAAEGHARRILPSGTKIVPVPSLEDGVRAVLAGDLDALGTGSVSARYQMSRHAGLAALNLHAPHDAAEPIAFALRPNPSLVRTLNRFLHSRPANAGQKPSRCTAPNWLETPAWTGGHEKPLTTPSP